MNTYMSGTLVRTSAQFTDVDGNAADPDTITLKCKAGSAATTTTLYPASPIVRDAEGAYHADMDTTGWTGPGNELWITEWIGTGNVQAPGSGGWEVEPLAL